MSIIINTYLYLGDLIVQALLSPNLTTMGGEHCCGI
jgi:hypothetical protein